MAQVELLMLNPAGNDGDMRQLETVPVVTAVCSVDTPMVSTMAAGVNETVGLARRTVMFSTALPVPVLFESVIV